MLEIKPHRDFKKDIQRDKKSGGYGEGDFKTLAEGIHSLSAVTEVDEKFRDHPLKGNWSGYREYHVKPDWLLVYKADLEKNSLKLARLGSHNQIFNK